MKNQCFELCLQVFFVHIKNSNRLSAMLRTEISVESHAEMSADTDTETDTETDNFRSLSITQKFNFTDI